LCLVVKRPLWEKAVIIASSVPIALVVNLLRITATGLMYEVAGEEWAHAVFHDLAGWLMMPVALALLGLELLVLKDLFLEAAAAGPVKRVPSSPRPSVPTPRLEARPRPAPRRQAVPIVPRRARA